MKDLYIVGASGCGREVLQWVKDINAQKPTWNIKGFLDDNLSALDGYECDYSVVGTIVDYIPRENDAVVLAVASPEWKRKIVSILEKKGANFASIIHPRALISEFSHYGKGLLAYPNVILGPNTTVGNYCTLLSGAGHDAVLEDFVTTSSYCDICGHAHIKEGAFLASHCTIIPNKVVGKNAYVGAGSIVIRNVPDGKKVFGNPAKVVEI